MALRGRQDVADEVLMLRFQRGDIPAFALLVQRYKSPLYNFTLHYTGDSTAAENLFQNIVLHLVQTSAQFKSGTLFASWLYGIARNLCLEHMRYASFPDAPDFDETRDANPRFPAPSTPPFEENESGKKTVENSTTTGTLIEQLVCAVEKLPQEQREVFLLRQLADLPFKEIASITGFPEETIKARMRYAFESLQSSLHEDDLIP